MNKVKILEDFFQDPPEGITNTEAFQTAIRGTITRIASVGNTTRLPAGTLRKLTPAIGHVLLVGALRLSRSLSDPPTSGELDSTTPWNEESFSGKGLYEGGTGALALYQMFVSFMERAKTPLPVEMDVTKPILRAALRQMLTRAKGMNTLNLASSELKTLTGNDDLSREVVRRLFRLIAVHAKRTLRRECNQIRQERGLTADWAPPLQADEDPSVPEEEEIT